METQQDYWLRVQTDALKAVKYAERQLAELSKAIVNDNFMLDFAESHELSYE